MQCRNFCESPHCSDNGRNVWITQNFNRSCRSDNRGCAAFTSKRQKSNPRVIGKRYLKMQQNHKIFSEFFSVRNTSCLTLSQAGFFEVLKGKGGILDPPSLKRCGRQTTLFFKIFPNKKLA